MSQADQLLKILEAHPGRWVSTAEILRDAPCVVHSRMSELRDQIGARLEHRTVGRGASGSQWRVCALAGGGQGPAQSAAVDKGHALPAPPSPASAPRLSPVAGALPEQLELVA